MQNSSKMVISVTFFIQQHFLFVYDLEMLASFLLNFIPLVTSCVRLQKEDEDEDEEEEEKEEEEEDDDDDEEDEEQEEERGREKMGE